MKARSSWTFLCALAIAVAAFGCSKKGGGPSCATASECATGEVCSAGECLPCGTDAECRADRRYGPASSCNGGVCCAPGERGCGCDALGECTFGNTCEGGICGGCARGTKDCPCARGMCEDDLQCLNGICAAADCTPGVADCPCTTESNCEGLARCSSERICRSCTPGTLGCECLDGGCEFGLSCTEETCEECVEGSESCACREGEENPCDEGLSCFGGTCAPPQQTCAELNCAAQGRVCEGEPFAECTVCDGEMGFVPEGDGCVPSPGVCTSSDDCADGEFCIRLSATPPFCTAAPSCVDLEPGGNTGKVWDPATQACDDCPSCEGVPGSTGRLWPVKSSSGACLCETVDGYYFDTSLSALAPRPCDEDGDGWTRNPARQFIASPEVPLRDNARCDVGEIDGFHLQNERGQRRLVTLADLELTSNILLYESENTDRQSAIDSNNFMPPIGRRFQAAELNPLTKACNTDAADYNANDIADIAENPLSSSNLTWMRPFWRMSYFVELHDSWLEEDPDGGPGKLVIAEVPRCESDFPLQVDGDDYWRECMRGRAADFNVGVDQPGYDFAEWTCGDRTGSCALPDPVSLTDGMVDRMTGAVVGATTAPDGVPVHGSCSAQVDDPFASWDGMGHHSQFQCVKFVNTLSSPRVPWEVLRNEIDAPEGVQANECELAAAGDGDASATCTPAPLDTVNPSDVGWAAWEYEQYAFAADYERSCVNECPHLVSYCDQYHQDDEENGAGCSGLPDQYGRLECNLCPDAGEPCETDNLGACTAGVWACNDQGTPFCEPLIAPDLDRPDPLGDLVDSNCDGFDGVLSSTVFVSSENGVDGIGTADDPVRNGNLALAFQTARTTGASHIVLDEGTYVSLAVDVDVPVTIAGGFQTQGCPAGELWCRPSTDPAEITRSSVSIVGFELDMPVDNANVSQSIAFVTRGVDVTMEHLAIELLEVDATGNPSAMYSKVGIFAEGTNLTLRDVSLVVPDGLPGDPGQSYGTAPGGRNGNLGETGCQEDSFACTDYCSGRPQGGTGGASVCAGRPSGGGGGKGGLSGYDGGGGARGSVGGNGTDSPEGLAGGARGAAGSGASASIMPYGDNDPPESQAGKPGSASTAAAENGEPALGAFTALGWAQSSGDTGDSGAGGGGGGGGGGGRGDGEGGCVGYGGAGAGGGGGGCGGFGGGGGLVGGASLGIYGVASATITLESSEITVGNGGAGGDGGKGETGGPGGRGGAVNWGNKTDYQGSYYSSARDQENGTNGGRGGDGGKGGDGGHGGAAQGGPSVCLVTDATSTATADSTMNLNFGNRGANGVPAGVSQPVGVDARQGAEWSFQ